MEETRTNRIIKGGKALGSAQVTEEAKTTTIIFSNFVGLVCVGLKLPIVALRIDPTKNTGRSIFRKI